MDPVAAVPQAGVVSVSELIRRRRMIQANRHRLAANDGLFDAARDLRRRAQQQVNAGHPELARPYLDEAELFESAAQPLPAL
jgi:hypothetical protein